MRVFRTLVQLEHRPYCMTYTQMLAYTESVSRQCTSKLSFIVDFPSQISYYLFFSEVLVEDPTMNTPGCSYSRSTANCDVFQLQCNDFQRIQILDSKYGKMEQSPSTASSEASRSVPNTDQRSQPTQCRSDILRPCTWSGSYTPYNSTQRYDLYKKCSWKSTCQPPSVGKDIAHSISYRCVPGGYKIFVSYGVDNVMA